MATAEPQRVLKADAVRELKTKIAFNYEDIRRRCDDYLAEVGRQARQTIEQARREADAIRRRALEEGRRLGHAEGLRQGQGEIEQQAKQLADQLASETLRTAFPALQAAVDAVEREREQWLAEWESLAVRLSVAIAEKLVRHQIEIQPQLVAGILSQALELAVGTQRITVRMHPLDIEQLGEHAEHVIRCMASCLEAELQGDETVSRGGCLIETQHGRIDATLETRLDRITSELLAHNTHATD